MNAPKIWFLKSITVLSSFQYRNVKLVINWNHSTMCHKEAYPCFTELRWVFFYIVNKNIYFYTVRKMYILIHYIHINLNEIFSIHLQISYPYVKTTYYLFFINLLLMDMYIYTNIYIFFIYNKIHHGCK